MSQGGTSSWKLKQSQLIGIYFTVQFVRFLAVGGIALALHWLARFAFNEVMPFWQAVVCAYAVGIASAYVLNRIFVFPASTRGMRAEMLIFVAINVLAFPFVWGASVLLGEILFPRFMGTDLSYAAGHGIAICLPVLVNFALHKFWTFRETRLGK